MTSLKNKFHTSLQQILTKHGLSRIEYFPSS